MKRRIPSFRPLFQPTESHLLESNDLDGPSRRDNVQSEIAQCLHAFTSATRWGVEFNPPSPSRIVDNWVSDHGATDVLSTEYTVDTGDVSGPSAWVSMDQAAELLCGIDRLIQRIDRTESALRDREAQLSGLVAFSNHAAPSRELAARLESVLESTAISLGAVCSALYLLDENTTELKLRATYGLPRSRFTLPPRDLRSSLADIEALTGNAVLLSDTKAAPQWQSPEPYRSALVVPIGTTTMPHGTVWFWSNEPRSYTAAQIEVANLAAGRLMGEIEQSILGSEVTTARHLAKQLDRASEFQASMLADYQILHEDYDLGGWSHQQGLIGGAFHRWSLTQQNKLSLVVGSANANHATGSMIATSALTTLDLFERGFLPGTPRDQQSLCGALRNALQAINDQHWSRGNEAWHLHATAVEIHPETGTGIAYSGGDMHCLILGDRGIRHIGSSYPCLGSDPDQQIALGRFILEPNDMLVAFTSGMLGVEFDISKMLKFLRDWREEPACDLACSIAEQLPLLNEFACEPSDRALVILKNLR